MQIFRLNNFGIKGFTLLETIIYFALLSIILLIVVDLFFRISESSLESSTKNAIEVEGAYILNRFAYDIHRVDVENGDIIIQPDDPGESHPFLALSIDGTPYVYGIVGGRLILFIWGDGTSLTPVVSNATNVENILVTRLSNNDTKPTVKISFTLESNTPSKDGTLESKDFESVFSVR